MKKTHKIIAILVIATLTLVGSLSGLYIFITTQEQPVVIPPEETLHVGYYKNAPKTFQDSAGNPIGIFPELLEYIAKQENWEIVWEKNDWSICLKNLSAGEIDIMIDVAYSDERAEEYEFNNIEVLNNWGLIYTQNGANIETKADLNNTNIAVMNDSIHTIGENGILNLTEKWGYECNFTYFKDYHGVFEAISNGTSDAGVVNRLFGAVHEKDYNVRETSIIINPNRLLFAFPQNAKRNPMLISNIDERLLALKENTDSFYYQLLNTYIYQIPEYMLPEWFYPVLIIAILLVVIFISLSVVLLWTAGKLKSTNSELKKLNELQSIYVASMNHELKSPLTAIIGFTDILLKAPKEADQEQEKALNIIKRNANYLLELINDIIYVSELNIGDKGIKITKFNLSDQITNLKEDFLSEIEKKQLNLKLDTIQNAVVKNDKKKIKEILINLLGNAIKYTDHGEVSIYMEEFEREYRVVVKDSGRGIQKEYLDKLFDAFFRVPTPGEGKKGSGLGLYISKKLASQIGSNIEVFSQYGKGTTFRFTVRKGFENLKN